MKKTWYCKYCGMSKEDVLIDTYNPGIKCVHDVTYGFNNPIARYWRNWCRKPMVVQQRQIIWMLMIVLALDCVGSAVMGVYHYYLRKDVAMAVQNTRLSAEIIEELKAQLRAERQFSNLVTRASDECYGYLSRQGIRIPPEQQ